MSRMPEPNEWNTSALPECRRAHLESGRSFEDIVGFMAPEAQIRQAWIDPCQDRPPVAPANARRVCFRIEISQKTYDLFYNAPDGLRGLYWQGPDVGFLATKHLIGALKPKLIRFLKKNPLPEACEAAAMTLQEIELSLDGPSAKVWVREKDDAGNTMIAVTANPQLEVCRWAQNEKEIGSKGPLWRWTPVGDEIEIKGAILSRGGEEYVPESKRDRSCQIHRYGFT